MKANINYNRRMEDTLKTLAGSRPKLLLHVCCAPCSTSVIKRLDAHFRLVIFFDNPNMDSNEEFVRRAKELEYLLSRLDLKEAPELIIEPYTPDVFTEAIKGYESEKEGGKRCSICYALRLRRAAIYAAQEGIQWVTTTLSVSPHKDAGRLNRIGTYWAKRYGLFYLESDFKKKGGFQESCNLSDTFSLYRQDYCGCFYSKKEAEARRQLKETL